MELWEVSVTEQVDRADEVVPIDPTKILVQPNRLHSANAIVPFKTVYGVFAQPGDPGHGEVSFPNDGLSMTPDVRRWLEMGGQSQVGLQARVPRTSNALPWDAGYTVPMDGTVEV